MDIAIIKPHIQVITLGLLAGMRSMAAPAFTSRILSQHQTKSVDGSPLKFMQSGTTANILSALALGEFVGDKMPFAPDRIKPAGLTVRCISGALSGAGIYQSNKGKWYMGALIGGATAIAATFGIFYLRKSLVRRAYLMDPIIGTIEDAIVLSAGFGLARTV